MGSFDSATQQTAALLSDLLPATVLCVVDSKEAMIVPGQQSNNDNQKKREEKNNLCFLSFLFALALCNVAAIPCIHTYFSSKIDLQFARGWEAIKAKLT